MSELKIELIEEYLSEGYLTSFKDEVIDLASLTIDEFDRLLMEVSDGASSEQIIEVITTRLGEETASALFHAYDNVAGESLSYEMLNDDEDRSWKNSLVPAFAEDERKLKLSPRRKSPAKETYRRAISESGHANFIEIALPATGIRITIEPLKPRLFALLKMRIAREKIIFNRRVYGSKFDLNQAVADAYIVETIMGCVIESNLTDWTKDTLIELFDDRDLDLLCLRAILPYYPKGYNLTMQCSNVLPEKLSEEEESLDSDTPERELKQVSCGNRDLLTINLSHVMWYNYKLIDMERFAFSGMDKKVTHDEVLAFKESEQLRHSVFGKGTWEIELQMCTTVSRLVENRRWLTSIEKELTETFNNNVTEAMMIDRFTEVMAVEQLRNYIPYIKTFRIYSNEAHDEVLAEHDLGNMKERDKAADILEYLNVSDDIEFITESMETFFKSNQYAVPAYANRPCSKCGKPHREEDADMRLIPLEAKRLFFTIMEQRLDKAAI